MGRDGTGTRYEEGYRSSGDTGVETVFRTESHSKIVYKQLIYFFRDMTLSPPDSR